MLPHRPLLSQLSRLPIIDTPRSISAKLKLPRGGHIPIQGIVFFCPRRRSPHFYSPANFKKLGYAMRIILG
jgi:hypothetical protein